MKRSLLSLIGLLVSIGICSAVHSSPNEKSLLKSDLDAIPAYAALSDDIKSMSLDDFLNLTPKQYKELTGEKLGVKNSVKLKAAQKLIKRQQKGKGGATDIPKGLYIAGAIIGFAWILMGLMDDWEGNNWWLSLILFFLCWIPGVIHAFIKMDEYY